MFHSLAKYFQPPHQKERVHIKMHQINPRDQPYLVATAKVLKSHYSTNLQCIYIHENAQNIRKIQQYCTKAAQDQNLCKTMIQIYKIGR